MKIISWNVNGIRAVERKEELSAFLHKHDPDVLFIQETKSREEQVQAIIDAYSDYDQHYHSAEEKKGYSGTSIWVKKGLVDSYEVFREMPTTHPKEGRVMRVDIGEHSLFGVYFPNGGKSQEAWENKLMFYTDFLRHVNDLRTQGRKVIWSGDVNCAHHEIDLARPKDNDGKIGFHPRERAWLDTCVQQGWVDVFRDKYPKKVMYSWWHLISRARARNVGWRIDYFFADASLVPMVQDISYDNDQMGSDHCPVILDVRV